VQDSNHYCHYLHEVNIFLGFSASVLADSLVPWCVEIGNRLVCWLGKFLDRDD
jgi:hypothetical protein